MTCADGRESASAVCGAESREDDGARPARAAAPRVWMEPERARSESGRQHKERHVRTTGAERKLRAVNRVRVSLGFTLYIYTLVP